MKKTLLISLFLAISVSGAGDSRILVHNDGGICYRLDYDDTYCDGQTMIVNGSFDHFIEVTRGANNLTGVLNETTIPGYLAEGIVTPVNFLIGIGAAIMLILVTVAVISAPIILGVALFVKMGGLGQKNG